MKMETTIYYFTGTGNSLKVAQEFQSHTDGCHLVAIPHIINQERIILSSEKIGFIFPLYYLGMPKIVIDFINKIEITHAKYIFAVVTRGWPVVGGAVKQLRRLLKRRGYRLNAGLYIHMPMSHFIVASVPPVEKQQAILRDSAQPIAAAIETVKNNERCFPMEPTSIIRPIRNGPFVKNVNHWDTHFHVADSCIGCKICEKVCSVGNITMKDDRPLWHHQCQLCLSCFHYCPQNSIQFADKSLTSLQYHHPDIKVADLIKLRIKAPSKRIDGPKKTPDDMA